LRGILAERERVANHLWDIAAILNDVGFTFGYFQFGRLRELCLRLNQKVFGHRLLMDLIVPGGVGRDLAPEAVAMLLEELPALNTELAELDALVASNPSVQDRLVTTGVLRPADALALSALGYVARASGQSFDLRRDAPYPPYDRLSVTVPVVEAGDVAARMRVRWEEIRISLQLIHRLLHDLPSGPVIAPWTVPDAGSEGLGLVEGWRGECLAYVHFGSDNTVCRYYPRDPSLLNWPALEYLIQGNIVPEFPVCNKSVNGSYSGHDL
jgi:Ni,Fe-hydrogenase III large subunit